MLQQPAWQVALSSGPVFFDQRRMKTWLIFTDNDSTPLPYESVWQAKIRLSVVGPVHLTWRRVAVVRAESVTLSGTSEVYEIDENRRAHFVAPLMQAGGLLRGFFDPGELEFEKLKQRQIAHESPGAEAVNPDDEQIRQLLTSKVNGPVWMINLLKYREEALYPESSPFAAQRLTGRDAYLRYSWVALRSVALLGGEILLAGNLHKPLRVGSNGETFGEWDELAIVRYPQPQSLLKLVYMPGYIDATLHRTAALASTRLIMASASE